MIGSIDKLKWKSIYKGFREFNIPLKDNDTIKLIKMDPGTSVPLHSHNGKEYILVIDGSFCDEYGEYKKGDMQINDQKIKNNPSACDTNGCICLSITESDVVFFGKFASILNLFTFIKSFFK
jgi:putative transcriptional regulator